MTIILSSNVIYSEKRKGLRMKSNLDDELSLEKIDDYNGKESKEKKRTVIYVVLFCLIVGAVLTFVKSSSQVGDYVGTKEAPGIDVSKK